MNPKQRLVKFLNEILQEEHHLSRETLASYIVGELIGDHDDIYKELLEDSPQVKRMADLASDLEWSNGSEQELDGMWLEIKALTRSLQE